VDPFDESVPETAAMDDYEQKRQSIGIRKSATYPHLITLYKKDWSNEQAWEHLLAELNLPPETPQVGLLLSRGGIRQDL